MTREWKEKSLHFDLSSSLFTCAIRDHKESEKKVKA